MMPARPIILLFAATAVLAACKSPYKESDKQREIARKDAGGDPNFQAFVGRLRTAVERKDVEMLRTLMVPQKDFGYRWDNPPPGDNVFTYWDLNNLWPELQGVIEKGFAPLERVPGELFMVAPPELATDPNYAGYRVGLKQIMGSWKFVYFVPPPPPDQMAPQ